MKYIVVNRNNIKQNLARTEDRLPVFSLHDSNNPVTYDHTMEIWFGDVKVARFIYDPDKPKGCGASAWLEVLNGDVLLTESAMNYKEVCEL